MSNNIDILIQLEKMGLSKKAAAAYTAALKLQRANANQIAMEAGIERTTIYNILQELKEMRLVGEGREGKRIIYWAESPANFQNILRERLEGFKNLLPLLTALEGKVEQKPVIKYYEGRTAISRAYWESLKCKEKLFRNIAAVANVEELFGGRFIERYTNERVKRKIVTRSMRAHSEQDEQIKSWYLKNANDEVLRENRYLPKEIMIDGFIKIFDDTIMLVTFGQNPSMIVVESAELAQTIKMLYDIVWQCKATSLAKKTS